MCPTDQHIYRFPRIVRFLRMSFTFGSLAVVLAVVHKKRSRCSDGNLSIGRRVMRGSIDHIDRFGGRKHGRHPLFILAQAGASRAVDALTG